jgi:hypothetical protein
MPVMGIAGLPWDAGGITMRPGHLNRMVIRIGSGGTMTVKARVVSPEALRDTVNSPVHWNDYSRHYLAEGDSWFSMAALPGGNLLQELRLREPALIVNCAFPGDTLSHMVEWRKNPDFTNLLARKKLAYSWDALLLSAGGNDLIDAALASPGILRRLDAPSANAADYIDEPGFALLDSYLRANFQELVDLRDAAGSPNQGIPIVIHTYDFPTPRPAPERLVGVVGVLGPWLHKAFTGHAIPSGVWQELSDLLLRRLHGILTSLDLPGVRVIDTLGTLDRAATGSTGDSGDWLNEIHANLGGRRKLAAKWAPVLDTL